MKLAEILARKPTKITRKGLAAVIASKKSPNAKTSSDNLATLLAKHQKSK